MRVFAAHFSLAKSGELWPLAQASARSASQCARPGQGVPQALARARNRTCMELSSALDGRTLLEPGSGSFSSSIGCENSCRGAIVRSTACAEFCFISTGSVRLIARVCPLTASTAKTKQNWRKEYDGSAKRIVAGSGPRHGAMRPPLGLKKNL
eukprot:scaffold8780_cov130-Isochrysis_galbana.AAC.1